MESTMNMRSIKEVIVFNYHTAEHKHETVDVTTKSATTPPCELATNN